MYCITSFEQIRKQSVLKRNITCCSIWKWKQPIILQDIPHYRKQQTGVTESSGGLFFACALAHLVENRAQEKILNAVKSVIIAISRVHKFC